MKNTPKGKTRSKKVTIITIVCLSSVVISLFAFSRLFFHRSLMATIIEWYMLIIDRDSIYSEGAKFEENLALRAAEDPQDYDKPTGVNMKVSYNSTFEHNMKIFSFNEESYTDTLIIYVHGGGYLNAPLKYHWKIIDYLAEKTDNPILMPIYLKASNYTCDDAYAAMIEFYLDATSRENLKKVVLIGDSSGGAMALVLAQLLRDTHPEAIQPDELILIAPWLDVSMDNPDITDVEPYDPMLDLYGARLLGEMWAGDRDVHDPMVSPIYGNFENLGHICIFVGTRDMLWPDAEKLSDMLDELGIEHLLVVEEGLNHPYPLFPIPEAAAAKKLMVEIINRD